LQFAVGGVFLECGDPVHVGDDAAKSGEWRAGFLQRRQSVAQNANGVPSFSPRLERSDYLGGIVQKHPNPNGVGSNRRAMVMQPRWG
jgi:hypothetical protein